MKKIIAALALSLLAGAAASVHADSPGPVIIQRPTTTIPTGPAPLPSEDPCPNYWHMRAGSKTVSGAFTCDPDKAPAMVKCPAGTEYFDDGCVVGCQKLVN